MLRGIKNTSVSSHLTIEYKKNEKTHVLNLYLSFEILKIDTSKIFIQCIIISHCVINNNTLPLIIKIIDINNNQINHYTHKNLYLKIEREKENY